MGRFTYSDYVFVEQCVTMTPRGALTGPALLTPPRRPLVIDGATCPLCPALLATVCSHPETRTPLDVDGRDVWCWLGNAHAVLFNYTRWPAVVLPCARNRDGLPQRHSDSRALSKPSAAAGDCPGLAELTGGP